MDLFRLQRVSQFTLVLMRSLTGLHAANKRSGATGWAHNTVGKFWKGYELDLARYALALAEEWMLRPLGKDAESSFKVRKETIVMWREIIEFLEDKGFREKQHALIGDEDFHSGWRSLLLYKEIQDETFKAWKQGKYQNHMCTKSLLPKKASWVIADFERIWETFGRPKGHWYAELGWTEEPTNMRFFYLENKVPFMLKEIKRKIEKPYAPYKTPAHLRKKEPEEQNQNVAIATDC